MDFRKNDFPILGRNINGFPLAYLDNAATTQKPISVIRALTDFYEESNANVHRSVHSLGVEATEKFEQAREKIARFINAQPDEIIFTKNATESINLVAYSLMDSLKSGDEVYSTLLEHHSNFVPWQQACLRKKTALKLLGVTADGKLALDSLKPGRKTNVVAFTHCSNALGTLTPAKQIIQRVREKSGALVLLDAAQSAPSIRLDVKKLDCDFMAFSAHKLLGPLGVGVLYAKRELLEKMPPFLFGGEMVAKVGLKKTTWASAPQKFEAGTPNVAGVVATGAAVDYLNKIGLDNILSHEQKLAKKTVSLLSQVDGVTVYGPKNALDKNGVVSFNLHGVHAHDVAEFLNSRGIAIRGGNHCAQNLMDFLGLSATARASYYFYNTEEQVTRLYDSVVDCMKVFKQ